MTSPEPAKTPLRWAHDAAGAAALDAECRRVGEARAAGHVTGAEAAWMAALACLLHDLGVVTP